MINLSAGPSEGLSGTLPEDLFEAIDALRATGKVSRILFVPGPGDVFGTWKHWASGRDDPSIPAIGYSHQVYELADRLGAQLIVLSELALPADAPTGADAPVRFVHRPGVTKRGLFYHPGQVLDALGLVRRAATERSDLIICQKYLDHFWPLALARLLGVGVVTSLHNSLWPVHRAPTRTERIVGALNGKAFRFLGRPVICVSTAVRAQVLQICGGEQKAASIQIPQYRDVARGMWRARPAGHPVRRILYIGRVERSKGVFQLLEAFKTLIAEHPSAKMLYLGRGGHLEALRAAILDAGLSDSVDAPGYADGAQVFAAISDSDMLICPTTTQFAEGLAKTPIEAALCGIPSVISTTVPCNDLLGDAVRVYPADDVTALHQTLDDLFKSPETLERMNLAAKDRCAIFFDRDQSFAARLFEAIAT
jgi:glycogen(starch) synthase